MESATFETLETTKAFSVTILLLLENHQNVTILQQLAASMRSMDGCEALSKEECARNHEILKYLYA